VVGRKEKERGEGRGGTGERKEEEGRRDILFLRL
jgi:hypothetical protein